MHNYNLLEQIWLISFSHQIGYHSSKQENSYGIEVVCKDMRSLKFAHKQVRHGIFINY